MNCYFCKKEIMWGDFKFMDNNENYWHNECHKHIEWVKENIGKVWAFCQGEMSD